MMKGNKQGFSREIFVKAVRLATGANNLVPVQAFDAIVQAGSQDSDTMTCVVDSCDSTLNNLQVRYNLCISDGEIAVPADDSTVTVIKTAFTDPYIVKSTDLNSKMVAIGNQSWSNDGVVQDFEFYVPSGESSGSYGGFIKDVDPSDPEAGLLKKLNNLEQLVNTLLATLQATVIPLAPSGTYPFAPLYAGVDPLTPTVADDVENPHIIHGLKNLPS